MGVLSKGIKLSYKANSSASTYTDLTNLQSIPEIGGTTESVEITTLDDAAHMYMNGIISYGDSIAFTFLYDQTQFTTLQALTGSIAWKVSLPDGNGGAIDTTVTFNAEPSVVLAGVGVNEALTYTLNLKPTSAMVWA